MKTGLYLILQALQDSNVKEIYV